MLIGLYGGTFDPVHVGHIHAALAVKNALHLDEVRMVLAARPGHRDSPRGGVQHRWTMLCLACAEHPGLVADNTELLRAGRSYTVDTVSALRELDTDIVPCWILGQDSFATLPAWHRWRELLDFCNLIIVARPGRRSEQTEPVLVQALCAKHETSDFNASRVGQIWRLKLGMKEVSATDIRQKLACGGGVEGLLAAPVYTYIKQHRLYSNVALNTENTI